MVYGDDGGRYSPTNVQQVNPPPPRSSTKWNPGSGADSLHTVKMTHLVTNLRPRSISRIVLSLQLWDHFLSYERREGGVCLPYPLLSVSANECALSQHYTCRGTHWLLGVNECGLAGIWRVMWWRACRWNVCTGSYRDALWPSVYRPPGWELHFDSTSWNIWSCL